VKIVFILKGDLRTRNGIDLALDVLRARLPRAQVDLQISRYPGHAVSLAAEARADCDYLIAAGGDGTLNEVVNGCLQGADDDPERELPCLGVMPLGSANDFARTLGVEKSAEALVGLIASNATRAIDVGRLRCHVKDGDPLVRYFVNVADVGIGAKVVERLAVSGKRLGPTLSYLGAIVATFIGYHRQQIAVESDNGLHWECPALIVVAGNGRYFGAGLCATPQASPDNGELALTLIGDASLLDFARYLGRLKRGELLDHPAVSYHRDRAVRITSSGGPAPVEADGEFLGYTPVDIELLPGRVRFLAPMPGE
jgi:diacylglycerol kinase (ATP)